MGTKFANIHIYSNDIERIKESLTLWYRNEQQKRNKLFGNMNILPEMKQLFDDSLGSCYIGSLKKGWHTILYTNFGWESVNNNALVISQFLDVPILSIGYFDDDVFTLGVIRDGKVFTEHISGNSLEVYDLEDLAGNAKIIVEETGLNISVDTLEDILKLNDLEEKVVALEEVFGLPLWINADWIEDEDVNDEHNNKWQKYKLG
jgi:hypothetical protein